MRVAMGLKIFNDIGCQLGRRQKAHLKRVKVRAERRRSKINPECVPGYGRYRGYDDYW